MIGPADLAGTPALALRPVTPADVGFLDHVYASTRTAELAPLGWPPAEVEAFLAQQARAQRQHYWQQCDTTQFHVVEADGEAAGRLFVEALAGELRIVDIALLPAWRGKGIGSRLLAALAAVAERDGLPLRIHVEAGNPAQRLYQRMGFRVTDAPGQPVVYRLMERPPGCPRHAA